MCKSDILFCSVMMCKSGILCCSVTTQCQWHGRTVGNAREGDVERILWRGEDLGLISSSPFLNSLFSWVTLFLFFCLFSYNFFVLVVGLLCFTSRRAPECCQWSGRYSAVQLWSLLCRRQVAMPCQPLRTSAWRTPLGCGWETCWSCLRRTNGSAMSSSTPTLTRESLPPLLSAHLLFDSHGKLCVCGDHLRLFGLLASRPSVLFGLAVWLSGLAVWLSGCGQNFQVQCCHFLEKLQRWSRCNFTRWYCSLGFACQCHFCCLPACVRLRLDRSSPARPCAWQIL